MSEQFKKLVADNGIPTTKEALKAEWQKQLTAQGIQFDNSSIYSPFWKAVELLITTPALWLINLLINKVLPQSFAKYATGPFLDAFAWAVGLKRKAASHAQGIILFTRTNTATALEIPANSVIQSPAINGVIYSVKTTSTLTMAAGVASIQVPIQATGTGSAFNLAEGYYSILATPIEGIATVVNAASWLTKPGTDTESNDDLRARIPTQYSAINQWHTDAVYRAIITSVPGISNGSVYFKGNAVRGPGTANAYILMPTGNASAHFLAAVQNKITAQGNHGHGDDLQVFDMPETQHTVTATLYAIAGTTEEAQNDLLDDVANFIRCAFRENEAFTCTKTLPNTRFSFSRLSSELHKQFDAVESINFDQSEINSELNIPRLQRLNMKFRV